MMWLLKSHWKDQWFRRESAVVPRGALFQQFLLYQCVLICPQDRDSLDLTWFFCGRIAALLPFEAMQIAVSTLMGRQFGSLFGIPVVLFLSSISTCTGCCYIMSCSNHAAALLVYPLHTIPKIRYHTKVNIIHICLQYIYIYIQHVQYIYIYMTPIRHQKHMGTAGVTCSVSPMHKKMSPDAML